MTSTQLWACSCVCTVPHPNCHAAMLWPLSAFPIWEHMQAARKPNPESLHLRVVVCRFTAAIEATNQRLGHYAALHKRVDFTDCRDCYVRRDKVILRSA